MSVLRIIGVFYENIYFERSGVVAWRDAGFFNNPCLISPVRNGLSRDFCGKFQKQAS